MKKIAFAKVLNRWKNENIKIEMLTTDRHSQTRKHMREEEKNIDQQFDASEVSLRGVSKQTIHSKQLPVQRQQ